MTRDELEFSISQYVDGTLVDDGQRSALEERLATDAEARALYAEYQTLQGVLVSSLPMPEVDWDQFASRVSAAVEREEMPAQSYKISRWFSRPMQFAVAASVLIAGSIALTMLRPGGGGGGGATGPGTRGPAAIAPTQIVRIDAPAAAESPEAVAATSAQPALSVAIVPPAADDGRPTVLYADSVVQRPSRAMIVSATPVAQDTSAAPF